MQELVMTFSLLCDMHIVQSPIVEDTVKIYDYL